MRLLNTSTGRFKEISDPQKVRYAILSHVWIYPEASSKPGGSFGKPAEMSYLDICKIHEDHPLETSILRHLSPKIQKFCEIAHSAGYELGWVDTCCIDQTSSSELSESINSMFNWYRHSSVCYVYLHDYRAHDPKNVRSVKSIWFNRGWTLQELLAPNIVVFYDSDWNPIGTKHTLAKSIRDACKVDYEVLTFKRPLHKVSVARRLSWATNRETSRPEDMAYSLMGLFGVNMTTMYGEGATRAFTRLQEEILKHIPDQTILCWGATLDPSIDFKIGREAISIHEHVQVPPESHNHCFLASSPKDFGHFNTSSITRLSPTDFTSLLNFHREPIYPRYTTTPYGVHVRLPIITIRTPARNKFAATHLALLACQDGGGESRRIAALLLRRVHSDRSTSEFFVGAAEEGGNGYQTLKSQPPYCRMVYISIPQIRTYAENQWIQMSDLYLPTPLGLNNDTSVDSKLFHLRTAQCKVWVSRWSKKLIESQGYEVKSNSDSDSITASRLMDGYNYAGQAEFSIVKKDKQRDSITVQVGRCFCPAGDAMPGIGCLAIRILSLADADVNAGSGNRAGHQLDHDSHIGQSEEVWALHAGVASREFCDITGCFILHVTFALDRTKEQLGTEYEIGFEIRDNRPETESSSCDPLRFMDDPKPDEGLPRTPPVSIYVTILTIAGF